MKVKIANKGYTLIVRSWENDADHHSTFSYTVQTLEEAKKIVKICKELFVSRSKNKNAVGNTIDFPYTQLVNYVKQNPLLFPDLYSKIPEDLEDLEEDEEGEETEIGSYFKELADSLMGTSEFYCFRVFESCTLTYLHDDVYADVIKIENE